MSAALKATIIAPGTATQRRSSYCTFSAVWAKTTYFKRLKGTDVLVDIGRDWLGDIWAQKYANEKKAVLVERLHEAVNNAATREALDTKVVARIGAWLPAEIRD